MQTLSKDYLDDVTVRLSHHSTAIEGNTISFNDVTAIILCDFLPRTSINKREFYEVENHALAMQFILDELLNEKPLTKNIILEINRQLLDRIMPNAGQFKQQANDIKGADSPPTQPSQTPKAFHQWFANTIYRLEQANTDEEKIKVILSSHIQFERIHPFQDGNGRTGRLIMFYLMLQENLYPFVITKEKREEYIDILATQDINRFYDLVKPCIELEKQRADVIVNKFIEMPITSIDNYFTGITALNIPSENIETGDWHIKSTFRGSFGRKPKFVLSRNIINTNEIFGTDSIENKSEILKRYGIFDKYDRPIYAANHYRAIADMMYGLLTDEKLTRNIFQHITLDDWLPAGYHQEKFFQLFSKAKDYLTAEQWERYLIFENYWKQPRQFEIADKLQLIQTLLRFEDIVISERYIYDLIAKTPIKQKIDDDDMLIIKNAINAVTYIECLDNKKQAINIELYQKLNEIVAYNQALNAGQLRAGNAYIPCIEQAIPPAEENNIQENLNLLNEINKNNYKKIVAQTFMNLIRMQPFNDGNKRSALLLCNVALDKAVLSKFKIPCEDQTIYNDFDNALTLFYRDNNREPLEKLIMEKCIF